MIDSLKVTLVEGVGQLKALLIGVNRYSESSSLSCCVQDAESLAEILSNSEYGANDKKNIKLMTDKSEELEKPTRTNIINNILSLSKTAQPTDIILFFFAGHGMEIDGEGFVLPSDFRQEAGAKGGISFKEIKDELTGSKARFKVLLFDACHSGSVKGRAETGKMTDGFYRSLFPAPKGFAVVSSCGQQEYSYEWAEKGHGVFSYYLLQGLEGNADENHDGFVDLSELHHYLTPLVQNWAFQNSKVQTPVIEANFSGLLPLTKATPTKTAVIATANDNSVDGISLVTKTREIKYLDYESELGESAEEPFRENMQAINAELLEEFKPSQLKEENDRIDFPCGFMDFEKETKESIGIVRLRVRVHFDFALGHREVSERILERLDDYGELWYGIGFEMENRKFDMDKLKQICDSKGYSIEKFQAKTPQRLQVRVGNWTSQALTLTFIDGENAFVGIEPTYLLLPTNFYSVLNPKNVLDIFGSALVPK